MNSQQVLKVFRIGKPAADDLCQKWIDKLKEYLGDECLVEQEKAGGETSAPWCGHPFVLAGLSDHVQQYLHGLSPAARRFMADCGYYWCLSEKGLDDDAEPEPQGRIIHLNWHEEYFQVLGRQLDALRLHSNLIGLSSGLHAVRGRIRYVASGQTGPGWAVLILGESGTGKEEVARALHHASARTKQQFEHVACGSLLDTLLRSTIFGIEENVATGVDPRPGLLETCSEGSLHFADFDAAPPDISGAMLSIMETPERKSVKFYRVGGEGDEKKVRTTEAWLMFSTNADIEGLLERERLRPDFIYRFEDRVILIPPLRERPADIPALARHLWERCWHGEPPRRKLHSADIEYLVGMKDAWEGNIRSLRALLSLATSMLRQPSYNATPTTEILHRIRERGPSVKHWVSIVATPQFVQPPTSEHGWIERIRGWDKGIECRGKQVVSKNATGGIEIEPRWALADSGAPKRPSEVRAMEVLTEKGRELFCEAVWKGAKAKPGTASRLASRNKRTLYATVRMSRIICFLALEGSNQITIAQCVRLNQADGTQEKDMNQEKPVNIAEKCKDDLTALEQAGLLTSDAQDRASAYRIVKEHLSQTVGQSM